MKRILTLVSIIFLAAIGRLVMPEAQGSYISNGGAGGSLPSQASQAGKFLQTDGSSSSCCLSWQTAGGSGGNIGTLASRPSAASLGANNLYFATDSHQLSRSNGASYAVFGPIYPITAADNTLFSWVNQGSATLSTNGGALLLSATASGVQDVKLRVMTAPATPYTFTALVQVVLNGTDFATAGVAFRESGTGRLHVAGPIVNGTRQEMISAKYFTPTSFSANYTVQRVQPSATWWLRLTDDGTNRIVSWSPDGLNFIQINSVSRTDFLTANQVGFYADSNTSNNPLWISLLSWTQS